MLTYITKLKYLIPFCCHFAFHTHSINRSKLTIQKLKGLKPEKRLTNRWINLSKTLYFIEASVTDVAIISAHPPMGPTIK